MQNIKYAITSFVIVLFWGAFYFFYYNKHQITESSNLPPPRTPKEDAFSASRFRAMASVDKKATNEKHKEIAQTMTKNVTAQNSSLEEKLSQLDSEHRKWTVARESDGSIKSITGGVLPDIGRDIDSIKNFIEMLAPQIGVPADQMSLVEELPGQTVEKIYEIKHRINGFFVEGAYSRIFARREDGGVYFFLNEIKPISNPIFDKKIDANEIQGLLAKEFPNREISIKNIEQTAVLFTGPDNVTELSWVAFVELKSPKYDRRKVIIGAYSEKVLLNVSMVVH